MSFGQAKKKHEEILKLIAQFRTHPCLWDNSVNESKSISARKVALEEIAAHMNAASDDVRRKLHNLRSQYRRETIRMKRLQTNRPKWLYYNSLKFLRNAIKIREDVGKKTNTSKYLRSNKITNETERGSTENDSMDEIDESNMLFDNSRSQSVSLDAENQNKSFEILQPQHNYTNRTGHGEKGVFVISRGATEHRDEYEVFGENVANELRALENNKNLQQALKCAIMQAILDVNKNSFDCATLQENSGGDDELDMKGF